MASSTPAALQSAEPAEPRKGVSAMTSADQDAYISKPDDDDVEGHKRRSTLQDEDEDVEGHKRRSTLQDEEEDVEGHSRSL
jgi:hypothetical protein